MEDAYDDYPMLAASTFQDGVEYQASNVSGPSRNVSAHVSGHVSGSHVSGHVSSHVPGSARRVAALRRPAPKLPPAAQCEEDEPLLFAGFQDDRNSGSDDCEAIGTRQSCLGFVDHFSFQVVANVVGVTGCMALLSEGNPELHGFAAPVSEAVLCFFIFELLWKAASQQASCCSGIHRVAWRAFDAALVIAGILAYWVLPQQQIAAAGEQQRDSLGLLEVAFRSCGFLRVLRVARFAWESDLGWTTGDAFQTLVGAAIAFNVFVLGIETDISWVAWPVVEQVFFCVYAFELLANLHQNGLAFLSISNSHVLWNWLDFIIVLAASFDVCWVPLAGLAWQAAGNRGLGQNTMPLRLLRMLRTLRLAKAVKSVKPLYLLVSALLATLQSVGWVMLLMAIVIYALGIAATRLVGMNVFGDEATDYTSGPFRSVVESMITLLRLIGGVRSEEDVAALDTIMVSPVLKFAFTFILVTTSWTILSVLVATVHERMSATAELAQEGARAATAADARSQRIVELRELFDSMGVHRVGEAHAPDVATILAQKARWSDVAQRVHVSEQDVAEVLQTLSAQGPITAERFVEAFFVAAGPATGGAFLRLERQFALQSRHAVGQVQQLLTHSEARACKLDGEFHAHRAALQQVVVAQRELTKQAGAEQSAELSRISGVLENLVARERHSREELFVLRTMTAKLQIEHEESREQVLSAVGLLARIEDQIKTVDRKSREDMSSLLGAVSATSAAMGDLRAQVKALGHQQPHASGTESLRGRGAYAAEAAAGPPPALL